MAAHKKQETRNKKQETRNKKQEPCFFENAWPACGVGMLSGRQINKLSFNNGSVPDRHSRRSSRNQRAANSRTASDERPRQITAQFSTARSEPWGHSKGTDAIAFGNWQQALCSDNMQRLTQAPNLFMATLWASALTSSGIVATVQRQYLSSVAGELPPDQCLPEVWIDDVRQESLARDVLYHLQHAPQRRWRCTCGELVEGGFEQCWQCGTMMPS